MRYPVITLLLLASTGATVAVAQDGSGHGPPHAPVIVPTPTTLPTQPAPTKSPTSFSAQPGSSFNEIGPLISSAREARRRGPRLA
jgi:hypothetical protein